MAKEALQYWVDPGRQRISTTPVSGNMDNFYYWRDDHIENLEYDIRICSSHKNIRATFNLVKSLKGNSISRKTRKKQHEEQ